MAIKQQFVIGLGVFTMAMICHTDMVFSDDMPQRQVVKETSEKMPVVSVENAVCVATFDSLKVKRFLLLTPQDKRRVFFRDLLLRPQDRYGVVKVPMRDSLAHSKLIQ